MYANFYLLLRKFSKCSINVNKSIIIIDLHQYDPQYANNEIEIYDNIT